MLAAGFPAYAFRAFLNALPAFTFVLGSCTIHAPISTIILRHRLCFIFKKCVDLFKKAITCPIFCLDRIELEEHYLQARSTSHPHKGVSRTCCHNIDFAFINEYNWKDYANHYSLP
jgi:hypothetical protein